MSIRFRRAVFECTRYAGEKVGAAVEECFCALSDKNRGGSRGVFEDRWEG